MSIDYIGQNKEYTLSSYSLQIKNSLGYYSTLWNSVCKSFLVVSFFPPCLLFQQVDVKCAQFTRKQKNPVLPARATGSFYASEIHWILSFSDHHRQGFCRINLCLVYIAQQFRFCTQCVCAQHGIASSPFAVSLCYVVSEEPRGLKKAANIWCCY